jgi:hypothetical protein
MQNIETIERTPTPFRIICDCIPSNWPRHALWVPENGEIYVVEEVAPRAATSTAQPAASVATVSLAELAQWRRALLEILKQLEQGLSPERDAADGVAHRISRLSYQGLIPREIAALMRAVSEMRNAAEYDAKALSAYESVAIRSAWQAVEEWWRIRCSTTA